MGSYITIVEYRTAPTAVDTNNLVVGGNQAAQDAELANVIARASAWMDNQANQPLVAAAHSQMVRGYVDADGFLSLHPANTPINQLLTLSVGISAATLASVDVSGAWCEAGNVLVPVNYPPGPVLALMLYVSGWPQTTLTAGTAGNAVSLPVASGVGFSPMLGSPVETTGTIFDGASTEPVSVTGATATTVACTALTNAHNAGAAVSLLPADLKQTAIMVTTAFIRLRASESLTMATSSPATVPLPGGTDPSVRSQLSIAAKNLVAYEKVR